MKEWEELGVWRAIWEASLGKLIEQGRLTTEETYIDATFRAAKKGVPRSGSRNAGRESK